MYFGLIKTTREWFQSDTAICRFRNYAISTLAIWLFLLFLHFRPSSLQKLQGSVAGSAIILFLGMILGVAFLGLVFGMGWYMYRMDTSPTGVKILWLLAAFVLPPFVEVAYFAFVYRRQALRARQSAGGH